MTETSTVQPAGIPYEHRQTASLELIEVADRMMRGAQSLMLKSARVMDPDPRKLGRLIGALRRYGDSQMPCTDEMPRIEALLPGAALATLMMQCPKGRKSRCPRRASSACRTRFRSSASSLYTRRSTET